MNVAALLFDVGEPERGQVGEHEKEPWANMTHRRDVMGAYRVAALLCVLCVPWVRTSAQIRQRSAADILADPSYAWRTDSTAHTRIHYLDGSPAADSLARVKRDIELSWTKAADFVGGLTVDRMIDVFAVPQREMVREISRVATSASALNFWRQRVVIVWVPAQGWRNAHELVHIMAYDAWGEPNAWWVGEGVAIAASGWFGVDVDAAAKCLGAAGKLLPLDRVVRGGTPDERIQNVAGAEAGSFVRFLIERYGREKVGRVYARGASALQAAYGEPLAQLEREWRQRVDSVGSGGVRCDAVVNAAR